MSNFKQAIKWLEEGKKVRRLKWKEDSYWIFGVHKVISFHGITNAHVHLNQIKATDWELYKERKPKVVILDDNEISIMKYAEEYPKNWKKICEELDKRKK